jgi:hypothetical protein
MDEKETLALLEEALSRAAPTKRNPFSPETRTNHKSTSPSGEGASSYSPLKFKDAAEFVYFFDPSLKSGKKKLYSWQIEELRRLSEKGKYTTANPLEYVLLAANGSGKDAYIIAGFVSYVLCCWKRYKVIITSASDLQLDSQTRNYIKYLCQNVNEYLRINGVMSKAIDIKKETFKSTIHKDNSGREISLTGSEVVTFVTNEGGRAEGHHPFPDADTGEGVILIVNEAKTVPQEIFDHFAKCTYNYLIQVSSAGPSRGHLYDSWIKGVEYPSAYVEGKFYGRRITAYDCPHISRSKIKREEDEFGPNDPWFKNTRLSLFSSLGESVVITEELLDRCLASSSRLHLGMGRRAGLDLSGRGNDYNTFYVIEDNELIAYDRWRAVDTEQTVDTLVGTDDGKSLGLFQKYGFDTVTCGNRISGDDNGIGQGIIDGLGRRGWNIRRVLNQSSAINNQRYLNRGAEMWFTFARILEAGFLHIPKDKLHPDLRRQLTSRHYSQEGAGKMKLWSKSEERAGAKGKKRSDYTQESSDSPDDADALILAFSTLSILDFHGKTPMKNITPSFPSTNTVLQNNRRTSKYFSEPTNKNKKQGRTLVDTIRSLYG